jgi:glycosyltransferase involved in cell wall biosynthesis
MSGQLLSILVPLYNEQEYIRAVLDRVIHIPLPGGLSREVVVVDDGSRDESVPLVEAFAKQNPGYIRLIRQPYNQGKGAAIRTAIENAQGDFAIIQDADLEYDPQDYPKLLKPLLEGRADAVFGSRFLTAEERRVLYYWHSIANHMLTTACNIVADINLTDMETCYKAFRMPLLKSIPLRSQRFGFEPEITIKLARRKARIFEVPINYYGRTYEEGKKIGLKDAFEALWLISRFAFTHDLYKDTGQQILHTFSETPNFNRWMAETVRPYVGKRVLEIGAGMGNLTRQLAPRRERYVCADIDVEHLNRLRSVLLHRPNVEAHICDLARPEDFAPFHGQMDSVICLNVLEHVEDDLLGLKNIHSTLGPGGRAIILVPEGMSVYGAMDKALGHYRRYSEDELRKRMQEAGFQVESLIAFNRISRPAWYLRGRVMKRSSMSRVQLQIFDRMVWLWKRIDKVLPWHPTSLIAVGVRR